MITITTGQEKANRITGRKDYDASMNRNGSKCVKSNRIESPSVS